MPTGNILPVNLGQTLVWKTRNFPEDIYTFNPTDNLTTLMSVLLGPAGTQQLSNVQIAARLTQEYMEFGDLDNILGQILNAPRLPTEIYSSNVNPFTDQLTPAQWDDVLTKDAAYRERLFGIASAYLRGATPIGLQNVAESTSGIRFRTIEVWNTTLSGTTISGTNIQTRGLGNNEVVLLPLVPSGINFTNAVKLNTLSTLQNLTTAGSVVTIASGLNPFVLAPYTNTSGTNNYSTVGNYTIISGNSYYFTFDRTVVANGITPPSYVNSTNDVSITSRYWLQNNVPSIAPRFAHLGTAEALIDNTQNITSTVVTNITANGTPFQTTISNPTAVSTLPISATVFGGQ